MKILVTRLHLTLAVLFGSLGIGGCDFNYQLSGLFTSTESMGSSFRKGVIAYQNGDYENALRAWEPLAKQGYSQAQNNMGFIHEKGIGVPVNNESAVKWYTLAANQGNAFAQTNLGWMHERGKGVPANDKQALKWWRLAAEQGIARAQYNMGVMYRNRQDDPQNITTA